MKILSPAGNLESLKMAIYNGADEVYLGINDFNARNNIDGFCLDTLKEAVEFAHIFDVRVCLAINILFSDDEIQEALDVVVDSYNFGVDAFIVQDIGLAKLIHENYPEIEIHASTQMGLHNLEGVKAVEKFGFKRVVLARETSLSEIKRIKQNTNVEIEYFAQGALCVSFSGNCYLSSYLCNASGNRGKCKQLCRLPYTLMKKDKKIKEGYLLSAKDFNMIERLADLEMAGVDVIKIEGRARRPFYVAMATREYRRAMDNLRPNKENLKLAFNREYSPGYFEGNGKIISNLQNHIGVVIGKVEKIVKGKKFNEIFISSNRKLSEKSTFKFFANSQERTIITAYDLKEVSKNKYRLTSTQEVGVGDYVNLIVDAKLESETLKMLKRRKIKIGIVADKNKPIEAVIELKQKTFSIYGAICEEAKSQPLTKNEIVENFNKSDLFEAVLNVIKLDDVFIAKKSLNEFRRKVFDSVYKEIARPYQHQLQKVDIKNEYKVVDFGPYQLVENVDENFAGEQIVYSPSEYLLEGIERFQEKCRKLNKKAFLDLPNFALEKDIDLLKKIVAKTKIAIVANNYYAVDFDAEVVIGAGLNIYNTFSAEVYDRPVVCAESDIAIRKNYPYMTLRHCPFKNHLGADCSRCPYQDDYLYKMENGKVLKLKRKKLSTCTFYLVD